RMDERAKREHEKARRRALARAEGLEPAPEDLEGAPEETGPEATGNSLISRLTAATREWRDRAVATLVARGADAVPALLGALTHASPLVRYHACDALGTLQDERAIEPLVVRLGDVEENRGGVAAGAEAALCRFGPRAIPALLRAAQGGEDRVRPRAVRLLGRIGGTVPLEPIRALLRGGDENVRVQAATALHQLAGALAAPELLPALADPSRYVRAAAAEALAQLGRREARPVLEAIAADPEDLYESRWAEELLELLAD
ncbi:MAG: HEAT repeat domain-containing protein, partial [Deltaproteobacteria bacterium]